jgi:hypothetical protein
MTTDTTPRRPEPRTARSKRRLRWPEGRTEWIAALLPVGLLVAIMGFFFGTRFTEATSALKSMRAVLVVAALAGVAIVLALLLFRFVPWIWVRSAVLCAAVLVFAFYFVLPGYQDHTVVEQARDVFGATIDRPGTPAGVPAVPDAPPAPSTAGPMQITAGTFEGIDHRAAGGANLIRRPDGGLTIELRDIDIQNGPDYDVYLVEGVDRQGKDGGVRIDDLKGNLGTQYYDVPADVAAGPDWTILIWCQTFGVPVANATQAAV